MRRLGFTVLFLGSALLPIVPACSSSTAASGGSGGDGGIRPNQPVGAPCDPTLASPCLPAPPCFRVKCSSNSGTCVETPVAGPCTVGGGGDAAFVFEASAPDAGFSGTCASNFDCPKVPGLDGAPSVTFVCAFSAYDGCSTAKGQCVLPEPPHTSDGAVDTACGCDGRPVTYVTATQTSAPAESPFPCTSLVKDAGADGPTDSGDAGATDGAAPDAEVDAPSDG